MKTKNLISLLVGITFVTLVHLASAAGQGAGGGGGFHGGALWLPDTLEAESAAAGAESALAERASQVAFRTLPAQGRGSPQWVIHHPDSLSMKDDQLDP